MAHRLPLIPRAVFTVIEPISTAAGFIGAVFDTEWFVLQQHESSLPVPVTVNSQILAWQLGNTYLLLGMVALAVLWSTSELKVVKLYLFALWLGDIGHIFFSCYGLGMDKVLDPSSWNALFMGNVFFTIFLFLTRSFYFVGLFGQDHAPPALKTKKQI